jgi:hypothetical protein
MPPWGPAWGLPSMGTECLQIRFSALAGLQAGLGWRGDWLHGFRLMGYLPTGCHLLVRGIQLVLLWAGDVESMDLIGALLSSVG